MNETEEVYKSVKTQELYVYLNGLLKYSDYGIRVLGFTGVGDGRSSVEKVCRTDEDGEKQNCINFMADNVAQSVTACIVL